MPTNKSSKPLSVALGISVCGLGGYMLYQYFKSYNREPPSVKIQVPSSYLGLIIGRRGCRIREIENQTEAKISIIDNKEEPTSDATCIITGSRHACCLAENLIQEIINDEKVSMCEVITVPEYAIGKLIGCGGTTVNAISNHTGAKIKVTKESNEKAERRIILRGTSTQIESTREYIAAIVDDSAGLLQSMDKRKPRKQSKHACKERISTPIGSSSFEVYVSAIVDPSRFWLQIVGPKAKELDQLVEEMTEFYKLPENRQWLRLDTVEKGDLVAAVFHYDERWYRAEVLSLNDTCDIAELHYVDYGDTDMVAITDLYELKVNYLELHFQAIECFLSRIEPAEGTWTSEAVDKFEEWAHVAHWRKLAAKLTNYSKRQRTRADRGSSPVPGVELYDVVDDTEVNIGDELVKQGYAVYTVDADENSRSTSSTEW